MTLHPSSFALGFILAYVLIGEWWNRRKEQQAAINKLLADTAITEMERME